MFFSKIKSRRWVHAGILALFVSAFSTSHAYAHEVYVLSKETVTEAMNTPGVSLFDILMTNFNDFVFWAFIGIVLVCIIFFVSISYTVERMFDPPLAKLVPYAPVVSRVTIGISFLAGAYYQSLFGPELPLAETFGVAGGMAVTIALVIIGLMIIFGFYARVASLIGLVIFGIAVLVYGSYMLTYVNYVGELILLLILGAHTVAFHRKEHDERHDPHILLSIKRFLTPYVFLILRVSFGTALIYAAVYAKIINSNLALMVASTPLAGHTTSLASVLGFSPEFLVLGAAVVEVVIGLFFIIGIEIRFTSLFLIFWLSLSLAYFGEAVWPHIILIGIPIAFIFYGYDKYSLEGFLARKGTRMPVL